MKKRRYGHLNFPLDLIKSNLAEKSGRLYSVSILTGKCFRERGMTAFYVTGVLPSEVRAESLRWYEAQPGAAEDT